MLGRVARAQVRGVRGVEAVGHACARRAAGRPEAEEEGPEELRERRGREAVGGAVREQAGEEREER